VRPFYFVGATAAQSTKAAMRKSIPQNRAAGQCLDRLDAIHKSCLNIVTLAELLEHGDRALLQPRTVSSAGAMIVCETEKLLRKLDAIFQTFPKPDDGEREPPPAD
jgi:hypothetical protein